MEHVLPSFFPFVLLCSDVTVCISQSNIVVLWNMLSQLGITERIYYSGTKFLKTLKFLVDVGWARLWDLVTDVKFLKWLFLY